MNRLLKTLVAGIAAFTVAVGWAQPRMPDPPKVEITSAVTEARPNQVIDATMTVTIAPGLHVYQNPQTDDTIIPIEVRAEGLVKVVYPKGESKIIEAISPNPYFLHSGTIQIPIQFKAPATVPAGGVPFTFAFQQCDDMTCFIPGEVVVNLPLKVSGEPVADAPVAVDASGLQPNPDAAPPTQPEATGLVKTIRDSFESQNWALIAGLMIVTGLLVNLTPCIYPLIPITLGFFSNQAKTNVAGRITLGLMYMLGIAITFGLVGGVAAASGGVFGELFTKPWFNIALGLMLVGLALSMFDVYQIGLPPFISNQIKGRSGPVGALIMGLFVGFGAAPCAGPFIVAVFTEVARFNSIPLGVGTFGLIGIGLGLPFVVLAALATGAKTLPKSGTWMKIVKAAMGLIVIYFGLDYILRGVPGLTDSTRALVWSAFYLAAAITLLAFEAKGSDLRAWWLKGIGALAFGFMLGTSWVSQQPNAKGPEIEWVKFTPESYAAAKASGQPILIDATADWCAECKVIDAKVFKNPDGVAAVEGVQTLKIDWSTGVDPAYRDMTAKQFGIVGLPHIVFQRPGGETSRVVNDLPSVEELKKHLAEAGANP